MTGLWVKFRRDDTCREHLAAWLHQGSDRLLAWAEFDVFTEPRVHEGQDVQSENCGGDEATDDYSGQRALHFRAS